MNQIQPLISIDVHTDGACRDNPNGLGAWGYIIKNTKNKKHIMNGGCALPQTTNNVAEYKAILESLTAAVALKPRVINVYSDSLLAIKQLNNLLGRIPNPKDQWKIDSLILKSYADQILKIIFQHRSSVYFNHVPREENKEADKIVNTLMDDYETERAKFINQHVQPNK